MSDSILAPIGPGDAPAGGGAADGSLEVWNLPRLRSRLAEIGLGW